MPAHLLEDLLSFSPTRADALLSSHERREDAAVWRYDDGSLLVATTDFFTPCVDDAYDFGRIAAANALSDIYAMGARPLFALNLLATPSQVPQAVVKQVMAGGAAICAEADAPIAGGHSIHLSEFVYGLAVVGRAKPEQLRRNATAQNGDALILSKPLGSGILSTACRDENNRENTAAAYAELLHWTTKLNAVGAQLAEMPAVHALTDISGFGLLGHLNEVCVGAQLAADLRVNDVPIMRAVRDMARDDDALNRNIRNGAQHNLRRLPVSRLNAMQTWQINVLADPQTSGGLLIACERASSGEVIALLREHGFDCAAEIGDLHTGEGIRIVR